MLFCPPCITPVRARDALSSHPGTVPSIDEGGNIRCGCSHCFAILLSCKTINVLYYKMQIQPRSNHQGLIRIH